MKLVLVLEDDRRVLDLFCLVLEGKGYAVLRATVAEEAFQHAARRRAQVDLLVADVVLTASTGIRVALQLRQSIPRLKILLVSGYPVSAWRDQDCAELNELPSDSVAVLQKPFRPEVLIERVRKLIGPATKKLPNRHTAAAR